MAADGDKVRVFFHPVLLPETVLHRFFEAVKCFCGLSLQGVHASDVVKGPAVFRFESQCPTDPIEAPRPVAQLT